MNSELKKYISKSGFKHSPICLLQSICEFCGDGYDSIKGDLLNIIIEAVDESDILDVIADKTTNDVLSMKVVVPIMEYMQGLIDEVEICDSLDALSPANDATIDIYLDNRDRARDMGAES